jgi:intein/homing endonuclease
MVREAQRLTPATQFPETAPAANPVFFRTYSRRTPEGRETWEQVCDRTLRGLVELGKLTPAEAAIIEKTQKEMKSLPSGRWLWVGGTEWISRQENFSGAYNCTSTNVVDWRAFGLMMDLAMMGCGTGAVLEPQYINQLPVIRNRLHVTVEGAIGTTPTSERREETEVQISGNVVNVLVGDSRRGWVKSYQTLLELSSNERFSDVVHIIVNLSNIRPAGEILKGFGGVANPIKLPELYQRCATILNKAIGRKLNSVECCLLIDEAAVVVVAGNVRRCLPEDALVHTSKGLIPIRDIQLDDLVQTPLGFRRVVDKFDQGVQEVYEIETNGTFPRATLNHRIAVLGDAKGSINWKQIGDLVESDRLMHNTQVLPGTVTQLPPDFTAERPIQSRNARPIIIPELTPEVAWLIGLTHGDGYVSLGRNKHEKHYGAISWACNSLDKELSAKIHHKIDRALALFGLKATHVIISGENTWRSRVTSIRLAEYFHKYIKKPNQPIEIPGFILQGSVDIRAAYLAGLMDGDGAINNRPPHLVTTVYRSFARQVAAVLSSLGIAGRVKLTRPQEENWQVKYNVTLPALKSQYNALIALHSVKGELRQGIKTYGFTIPGSLMREVYTYSEMREMGFQGSSNVDSNYERYIAESDVCLDIPVTVKGLGSYDCVQTYDIEVEEAHCFYCDGYLTHNSAGMRQGTSNDELFANAKTNLWQQDENGNWRIDPERDALRMANHTRVFHQKPTLEECINAVRNQYYSGEGAIQWAGEAVARSNSDLLVTDELKADFLRAYNQSQAKQWLQTHYPEIPASELEHRLARYGLNPCFTGETSVAVADGRQAVSFEQLAQEGKDVPVYTLDKQGIITVRWMRNPRITGYNQPILKVTFDDGLIVRCTLNHKFVMKDGSHKAAESLQYGDAVEAMTKYHHNIRRGKQDYVLISNGRRRIQAEHRLIAEFFYRPLQENEVVHHINFCGLNNSPNNLEIMDEIDHIQLHNRLANVAGELNPRYSNYSNEDLLLAGADLCKQLGQGFTPKQWQEYAKIHGYPQAFSNYRIKALGSWDDFSRRCAELAAVPVTTWDSRKGRVVVSHKAKYLQALAGDYISVRHNGDYYPIVTKICERCGCKFERKWKFRETSFCNSCSISIGNSGVSKTWTEETWQIHNQRIEKRKAEQVRIFNELRTTLKRPPMKAEWQAECRSQGVTHRLNGAVDSFKSYQELASAALEFSSEDQFKNWQELNHEHKRQEQIRVFNDLKLYLGRIPKQEEWIKACRAQGVSGRLGTSIHNFRNLSELIEAASEANHRVISVEFDGYETVYNGTVDEFHNFFIGHHNVQIERDKPKFTYVNVLNCGEIIFSDGHCNLAEIHLNQIDPKNDREQEEAFTAGALSVASLLNHKFLEPRYQFSRELDPIVGVSFTGLFDFFVRAFGVDWLRWWEQGRPEEFKIQNSKFKIENAGEYFRNKEREYLSRWRDVVFRVVWEYCDRHNIKRPNRCTTVQPSGTKSLLTGASPGWHPPKAQRFIRRITFRKNDPVALGCIDYGYSVVPSQSDKDEHGNLLNDPFDPRCLEWLVEIPVAVPWADLPGADEIDISQFRAIAQMDFYMQVQKYYVTHNTSATIELRENEVEALGTRIYETIQNDEGYISAALLARFDDLQTFPRLPFEPITKAKYEELMQQVHSRRQTQNFYTALSRYDAQELDEAGPAGCDSDKCLFAQEGGKG